MTVKIHSQRLPGKVRVTAVDTTTGRVVATVRYQGGKVIPQSGELTPELEQEIREHVEPKPKAPKKVAPKAARDD